MEKILYPPILKIPKRDGKYQVYTDAWDKKLGRVFLPDQEKDTDGTIGY